MGRPDDQELDERARRTLERFVVRARRIEAHSLAQDKAKLAEYGEVRITIGFASDGDVYFTQSFPPEEQLESAIARLRPMLLDDDGIKYEAALNALGRLARGTEFQESATQVKTTLKSAWTKHSKQDPDTPSYAVATSMRPDLDFSEAVSAEKLAFSWIYGDVVHADRERQEHGVLAGVAERHRAAAGIVCRLMVDVIGLLNAIRTLQDNNVLKLEPEVFTAGVVSHDAAVHAKVEVYVGEAGTDPDPATMQKLTIEVAKQITSQNASPGSTENRQQGTNTATLCQPARAGAPIDTGLDHRPGEERTGRLAEI